MLQQFDTCQTTPPTCSGNEYKGGSGEDGDHFNTSHTQAPVQGYTSSPNIVLNFVPIKSLPLYNPNKHKKINGHILFIYLFILKLRSQQLKLRVLRRTLRLSYNKLGTTWMDAILDQHLADAVRKTTKHVGHYNHPRYKIRKWELQNTKQECYPFCRDIR